MSQRRFTLRRARPNPAISDRMYRADVDDQGPRVYVTFRTDGSGAVTELLIQGDDISPELLREIPLGAISRAAKTPIPGHTSLDGWLASLEPLRKDDYASTDEFAAAVANQYKAFVAAGESPAKAIAEKSGVPTATVHAWIKLARRKGQIPEGQRGPTS